MIIYYIAKIKHVQRTYIISQKKCASVFVQVCFMSQNFIIFYNNNDHVYFSDVY